jgi:2-(3-amino-3-carboxypropyl)histidine synthase
MLLLCREQIVKARGAKRFGIILGTLGRQGSPAMYQHAKRLLDKHGKQSVQFLMAEIQPVKLQMLKQIDVSLPLVCILCVLIHSSTDY